MNGDHDKRLFVAAKYRGGILSCLLEAGKPVELSFSEEQRSIVGNLYAAQVSAVQEQIGGAFLSLGDGLTAWYSLGQDPAPFFLNTRDRRKKPLVAGDQLLVKIRREGTDTKAPLAVSRFPERNDEALLKRAACFKAPCLFTEAEPVWKAMAGKAERAVTDSETVYRDLTGKEPPDLSGLSYRDKLPEQFRPKEAEEAVRFYSDKTLPLTAVYALETAVSEATSRKVWLKSGGYLLIDRTEAMTVVDVNSGKFSRNLSPEESFRKVDLEAADELLRQLRLRNLSGIIIADFINLREKEHQQELLKRLREQAAADPMKTEIVDLTKLCLVEITRRKTGKSFAEQIRQVKEINR